MAIITRDPTSDIAVSGTWTGTAGSRYTLVDDYPSTSTGDQLTHGTTAGGIVFGFDTISVPTGSTSITVRVRYYDREATSGANNIGGRLRVGGVDYNATTHNPTTSTTLQTDTWTVNPRTGVAWTVTDVNGGGSNGLTGFGLNSTDASPTISITSIQLEVEYTPPLALSQSNYAFYEYGSESSSAIIGSQNTAWTFNLGSSPSEFLLRVMLQETNGGPGLTTDDYTLQFSLNGSSFAALNSNVASTSISNTATQSGTFSLTSSNPYVSQSFTGNGKYLSTISVYYSQFAGGVIKVYTHSGTYGTSSVPGGTLLATSASSFSSAGAYVYTFTGSGNILLEDGVNYVFVLERTSSDLSPAYTTDVYSGNAAESTDGSSWTTYSDRDLRFFITTVILTPVKTYSASPLTEGDATTNRLSGGTGSFDAGKVSLDGVVNDVQITANDYTELLYGVQLNTSVLKDTDTVTFRVVRNGVTTNMTYTVTPTINISAGVTPNTSAMFLLF